MSYELFSRGEENEYLAFSEGELTQDQIDGDLEKELYEAFDYIDQFREIIKNENEYADYVTANNAVVEYKEIFVENKSNTNEEYDTRLGMLQNVIIELANKLKKQEEQIPIWKKDYITPKEFELLYGMSEETQRRLRGRHKDKLEAIQLTERGNILYERKDVEKFFENFKK